jgi:hypothetical protein
VPLRCYNTTSRGLTLLLAQTTQNKGRFLIPAVVSPDPAVVVLVVVKAAVFVVAAGIIEVEGGIVPAAPDRPASRGSESDRPGTGNVGRGSGIDC